MSTEIGGGVTNYSAHVNRIEFVNISEEEKQRYESIIASYDIQSELKKYKELSDKVEIISLRLQRMRPITNEDREEMRYLRKEQKKLFTQRSEVSHIFEDLKIAMTSILQDRFKTVELEIDKNLENEKEVLTEENRKKEVESFRARKSKLDLQAQETLDQIERVKTEYLTPDNELQKLKLKAESMRITVAERENTSDILKQFEELKSKVESIKEVISKIEISDKLSRQEMAVEGELNKKVNELFDALWSVGRMMEKCSKAISDDKTDEKEKISTDITDCLRESITSKVEMDLLKEVEFLNQKKDSLWDKITGKAKVKVAKIQNLELKVKLVKAGGLMLPDNLDSMKDYISKYALVVGKENLPQEALVILETQNSTKEITDEEKAMFEIIRPQSMLLPVKKLKKEILNSLHSQNGDLDKKIQMLCNKDVNKDKEEEDPWKFFDDMEKNSRVENCLYDARFYASLPTDEEKTCEIGVRNVR